MRVRPIFSEALRGWRVTLPVTLSAQARTALRETLIAAGTVRPLALPPVTVRLVAGGIGAVGGGVGVGVVSRAA
jgi:hypothetical protein